MTRWPAPFLWALFLALGPAHAAERTDSAKTGAVGQIQPASGIIDLNASGGATITSVLVGIGDRVKAGQLLATVRDTSANHAEAVRQLDRARASAKQQVAAQEAAIAQAEQQLAAARRDYESYKALGPRSVSARELARNKDAVTNAELALKIENAKLVTTKANAANAVADAERQASLTRDAEELRAPIDGTVLFADRRIGAHPSGPVVRMGDLGAMSVVCQVYEGDLLKLRRGMRASIKSASLPQTLSGTVESVGRIVDSRAKLGEVRIRLDKADPADRLVGLEVEVTITH